MHKQALQGNCTEPKYGLDGVAIATHSDYDFHQIEPYSMSNFYQYKHLKP